MPRNPKEPTGVQIPSDLSVVPDTDLDALEAEATTEFDALYGNENPTADDVARMTALADFRDAVSGTRQERAAAAEALAAEREALHDRFHPAASSGDADDPVEEDEEVPLETAVVAAAPRQTVPVENVIKGRNANLNARLSDAAKVAPRVNVSSGGQESVLVASADIPGFTQGGRLNDVSEMARAFQARARSMPNQAGQNNRVPVASLQRNFKHTLGESTSLEQMWDVMQEATNPAALVAAGGWCSPSEIRYDFYNIADVCGLLDLPTMGINRGGIRWPTSPSFGDLAASTGLWVWNETQDVAAATGTAQSGTKTCARVPCAAFNEARLSCDGICITAGNFTTDAWPEQIANFLRLVNVAHDRRINTKFISLMVAASTDVALCVTGMGSVVPVLDAVEMQAIDLRTKYSMCSDAILEAVFPSWALGVFRADLAKAKPGYTPGANFNVTDTEIASWFTSRGIRAQWIEDYQVRSAGFFGNTAAITTWPATMQFMIYPAGTFMRGNGLNLDLGVVRDSVLNSTNDYTAAWSEECTLLAMIGHESRAVTVPICPSGARATDVAFNCASC